MYQRLHQAHRLIADVVSFKGPHINHLTPRTLDIDAVQAGMPARGIAAKAIVEGPPTAQMPDPVAPDLVQGAGRAGVVPIGGWRLDDGLAHGPLRRDRAARHCADAEGPGALRRLLDETRKIARPAADGSNAADYVAALSKVFEAFPDTGRASALPASAISPIR